MMTKKIVTKILLGVILAISGQTRPVDYRDFNLLGAAAYENNLDVVKLLLKEYEGAYEEINNRDADGNTPFMLAVMNREGYGSHDTALYLARQIQDKALDINLDLQNYNGQTALHLAIDGLTPIDFDQAAPIFEILIKNTNNINAVDDDGNTAFMTFLSNEEWRTNKKDFEYIRDLFFQRPDLQVDIVNKQGKTAADILKEAITKQKQLEAAQPPAKRRRFK